MIFTELSPKNWKFVEHYVQAFEPLYVCTKKLQKTHICLCDFYMSWLMTINEVSKMFSNTFAQRLTKSLKIGLTKLQTSQAFQMALYLDPRFNYLNSKLFPSNDEKQHIQVSVIQTFTKPISKSIATLFSLI